MAQDVTQDVFLKAFEAFERYDPDVSSTSWIYTIARNHIINVHAKTKEQVELEEIENHVFASQDGRERFAVDEEERALLEAIQLLSQEDARLVRMKYLEGWAFDELEDVFQKSSGTLRVQAIRALKKIKMLLYKRLG